MTKTCLYPQNTPLNAYRKGCRCDRCFEAKAATDRRRMRAKPCEECGGSKGRNSRGQRVCSACAHKHLIRKVSDKVVVSPSGCWIYTGELNTKGYGLIQFGKRQRLMSHRLLYEHWVGTIPPGLELDHLCRTPACCNPDHLEPVTHSENMLRAHRACREAAA